jgi:tripartite-type tricarboxylate transporter receptor subunit TctC
MSLHRIAKAKVFAVALVVQSALATGAVAAGYPDRIVRIVVPFAPGGGTDVIARALAQEMARDLGVSIIIENRPGAGTIIGTQSVASTRPTATRC